MLSTGKVDSPLSLSVNKEDNFPDWYTQVLTKSETIEYHDISGCYILRPNAYFVWEQVQEYLNQKFRQDDIKNCYFPIFVSKDKLETEKKHIEEFAPEVAWVTKSGNHQLEKEIAIRPTSETIIYPYISKWLQSHRDLPIKLNQWCNVVRWEFKHPTPLIRSREFLWQEGHTTHQTESEAVAQVEKSIRYYYNVYKDLMAVPVIMGRKTEGEKFPGSDFSMTVEAFIPENGRGIQAATSHFLGQNFSKMFNVVYEDDKSQKQYAYQTSWGLTTRSIGVMVMAHSDNKGLVLPPNVAQCQIIIIPTGLNKNTTDETRQQLYQRCYEINKYLRLHDIRSQTDLRECYTPPWKYNYWEMRGVPLRIDIGPNELNSCTLILANRIDGSKTPIDFYDGEDLAIRVKQKLKDIQTQLMMNSYKKLAESTVVATYWEEFLAGLLEKKMIATPFCNDLKCEQNLKELLKSSEEHYQQGVKPLCIPIDQSLLDLSVDGKKCINPKCETICNQYALFGKSY